MQSDVEGDDRRDCGSIIPLDRTTDIVVKIILISEKPLSRGHSSINWPLTCTGQG